MRKREKEKKKKREKGLNPIFYPYKWTKQKHLYQNTNPIFSMNSQWTIKCPV